MPIQLLSEDDFLQQADKYRPTAIDTEVYRKAALAMYKLVVGWLVDKSISDTTFDEKQLSLEGKYPWMEKKCPPTPYALSTALIHIAKGDNLETEKVTSGWSSYKRNT